MDNSDKMTNADPEFITIVEGPEPEFSSHNDVWALSLLEGADYIGLERCRLRTFNGPAMVERCRNAWAEGRPVVLDYPNRLGLRRQTSVAAARWEEVTEGMLLHLWVRSSGQEEPDDE
jgi:hypothetical protein